MRFPGGREGDFNDATCRDMRTGSDYISTIYNRPTDTLSVAYHPSASQMVTENGGGGIDQASSLEGERESERR